MNIETPTFAELLNQNRRGRSDNDLATEIGVTRGRVQQWSTGRGGRENVTVPSAGYVPQIARALNVTEALLWDSIGRSSNIAVGRPDIPIINRMPPEANLLEDEDVEFHLKSIQRTIDLRKQISGKKSRAASSQGSVTQLKRIARTSTGNEYRGGHE